MQEQNKLLAFFDLDKPITWRTEILAGLAVAMTMIPESLSFAILAGFQGDAGELQRLRLRGEPVFDLAQPGLSGGPELLDRRVELRAEDDREAEEEREQQERDGRRQRAVGVAGLGDPGQIEPQSHRRHHEDHAPRRDRRRRDHGGPRSCAPRVGNDETRCRVRIIIRTIPATQANTYL